MKQFSQKCVHTLLAGHYALALVAIVSVVGFLSYRGQDVVALLASATSSLQDEATIIYFSPSTHEAMLVGDSVDVDININAHTSINAVGITVQFPQESFEMTGISKSKSFLDLWTEETKISEESGEVHFSGGTLSDGGRIGLGTVLTLTLRAKKAGSATLSFKDAEIFKHDGRGETVPVTMRSLNFSIADIPSSAPAASREAVLEFKNTQPTDFNSSGSASLLDMSILTLHLFGPYSPRYDLNKDGKLNLIDLSVFFTFMKVQPR
jgi:Cohesin domain